MSVGTTYGRYFLLKSLAVGGMGEVFLARQQGVARPEKVVVVKRVLSHLTRKTEYLELFLQEARLQARLSHKAIVRIFDLGEAQDGSFYIAMEFVHGKSLVELLGRLRSRGERLPPTLAAQIIAEVAGGLSYAHGLTDDGGRPIHLIHRDISPHNILVSYQGEVKLIDFGIAKSEMNVVQTETGKIKGKFCYLSPEQSAASALDKRSDIFSLGIVLYECFAGANPFAKQNIVLSLQAIQQTDPPSLEAIDPALAPFDPIVFRALAKSPNERYADAAELQQDLARVREQLPAPPEGLGSYLTRLFQEEHDEEAKVLAATDTSNPDVLASAALAGAAADGAGPREVARRRRAIQEVRAAAGSDAALAMAGPMGGPTLVYDRPGAAAKPEPGPVGGSASLRAAWRRRPVWLAAVGVLAAVGIAFWLHSGGRASRATRVAPSALLEVPSASRPPAKEPSASPTLPPVVQAPMAAKEVRAEAKGAEATRAGDRPGTAEKAPGAKAEGVERKAGIAKVAAVAAPRIGTLFLKSAGECDLRVNGRPAAFGDIELAGTSGVLELRPQGAATRVRLAYSSAGIEVQSEPWSIVYRDGLSLGKTPLRIDFDEAQTRVELRRPDEAAVRLLMRYSRR